MTKILHTSDLHLGKRINGFSLIDSQKEMLGNIVSVSVEYDVNLIVIAGDIFDVKQPSVESVDLFEVFLEDLIIKYNKKVIVISGNHDSYSRLSFGKRLFKENLIIANTYDGTLFKYTYDDLIDFTLIPYSHYKSIKLIDDNHSIIEDNNTAFKYILSNKDINKLDSNKVNICVAHGYFSYNKNEIEIDDSVRKVSIGNNEIVDTSLFFDFDICMFGHLHRPQKATRDLYRYSGTPMKYSYSEVNHKKSVCIYTVNSKEDIKYELVEINTKNDLYYIEEPIDTLLDFDFYSKLNLEGYFKIHVCNEYIGSYISKLNKIYKNIVELTYDSINSVVTKRSSSDIKEKNTKELFIDFFNESVGKFPEGNIRKLIDEIGDDLE